MRLLLLLLLVLLLYGCGQLGDREVFRLALPLRCRRHLEYVLKEFIAHGRCQPSSWSSSAHCC